MGELDLVTVASYPSRTMAEAVRLRMENEGFSPFLADTETVDMDWFLGNAIGWIKLQVPSTEAERAKMTLRDVEREIRRSRWARHPHLRDSDESPVMEEEERFDEVERLIFGLRLQVATLYRFIEHKGLGTADELRRLMDQVDAEDGARDQEFYGDIVEESSPGAPD